MISQTMYFWIISIYSNYKDELARPSATKSKHPKKNFTKISGLLYSWLKEVNEEKGKSVLRANT